MYFYSANASPKANGFSSVHASNLKLRLDSHTIKINQVLFDRMNHYTDHLGNIRVSYTKDLQTDKLKILDENHYYPFGLKHENYLPMERWKFIQDEIEQSKTRLVRTRVDDYKYKYNGKEWQDELGLNMYDFGARNYMPDIGRTTTIDSLADSFANQSPYSFFNNNPIRYIDPDGRMAVDVMGDNDDWVEDANGNIYWDENATSQATTKEEEKYLGKNVLVGTHNRDADLNEPINTAQFDLYLESNKEGASATIMGNTIPADIDKYGTLAEGIFPAEYSIYKGDGAILINKGGNLPTVKGNPNNPKNYNSDGSLKPISEHVIDEVFFHKGNYARPSLSTSSGSPISAGCQTGGCGQGTLPIYRKFIKKAEGFKGNYYLRAKPVSTGN